MLKILEQKKTKKTDKKWKSHITEQGYALSDDEEISTDDIVIEDRLCCLYDLIEENNIDIN